jgi:rhodanese-related sulfurtransferase
LPGGDPLVHFESLKAIDQIADSVELLPGHDYQGKTRSTLGVERRGNPVLERRTREAYAEWWLAKKFGPADWMKGVVKANRDCTLDPDAVLIPKAEGACAAACAAVDPAQAAGVERITPEKLAGLLAAEGEKPFLLDVRTVEEFEGDLAPVPGSVLIPLNQLSWRADEIPSDRPTAIFCGTGARSVQAAVELERAGVEKAWVVSGGLERWRREGR